MWNLSSFRWLLMEVLIGLSLGTTPLSLAAQGPVGDDVNRDNVSAPAKEDLVAAPTKVDVKPLAHDEEI